MADVKEPESVRALRRIRELYADVDAWVTWADDGQLLEAYAGELLDHIEALTRERDAARRDLERLDWLEAHTSAVPAVHDVHGWSVNPVQRDRPQRRGATLREAIDAAMEATPLATISYLGYLPSLTKAQPQPNPDEAP